MNTIAKVVTEIKMGNSCCCANDSKLANNSEIQKFIASGTHGKKPFSLDTLEISTTIAELSKYVSSGKKVDLRKKIAEVFKSNVLIIISDGKDSEENIQLVKDTIDKFLDSIDYLSSRVDQLPECLAVLFALSSSITVMDSSMRCAVQLDVVFTQEDREKWTKKLGEASKVLAKSIAKSRDESASLSMLLFEIQKSDSLIRSLPDPNASSKGMMVSFQIISGLVKSATKMSLDSDLTKGLFSAVTLGMQKGLRTLADALSSKLILIQKFGVVICSDLKNLDKRVTADDIILSLQKLHHHVVEDNPRWEVHAAFTLICTDILLSCSVSGRLLQQVAVNLKSKIGKINDKQFKYVKQEIEDACVTLLSTDVINPMHKNNDNVASTDPITIPLNLEQINYKYLIPVEVIKDCQEMDKLWKVLWEGKEGVLFSMNAFLQHGEVRSLMGFPVNNFLLDLSRWSEKLVTG